MKMTQEQYDEAYRILADDCEAVSVYLDEAGCTCAVGALALAAHVEREVLIKAKSCGISAARNGPSLIWKDEHPNVVTIGAAIEKRFGLNLSDLSSIQFANDSYRADRARRQYEVLIALNKICEHLSLKTPALPPQFPKA